MSRESLIRNGAALLTAATCATSLALVPATSTAAPARATAKLADLVVTGPAADRTKVAEGAVVTVTHRVRNAGKARSAASQTRFYLTRDPAASLAARRASRTNPRSSTTDVLLTGVKATSALAPRKVSGTAVTKVTVPVGVQPGSYRVLVCADDRGVVRERNEADNCAVAPQKLAVSAAPGTAGLRVEQFADTADWPADESDGLRWMKLFCQSTHPVRAFTTASALTSIETFLEDKAGSTVLADVAASGLADNAVESQQLAATAFAQGSPGLALAALLRARAFEPKVGTHLVNLAALATSVGLPNQAVALLDGTAGLDFRHQPLGIRPQATALAVRGQALTMTGRLTAAREAFSAARVAEPLLSEADAGLAVVEACSGNDAKAMRYARLARQRADEPRKATEDPTRPEPARAEPGLDLSQGVVTPMRQLPLAETPAQGVAMHETYDGIADGFLAEIDASNAEADAIRERLRAVDQVSTRAEQERRDDITTFAYLVGTHGDEVDQLQERVFDKVDLLVAHTEKWWGGGTGEVEYLYERFSDEAHAACAGSTEDYATCRLREVNARCRPALVGGHTQWEALMSEAQNLADEWMLEASTRMSAYAANLADPDAHRRILLQIEDVERGMYGVLVQQAQHWTHYENLYEDECVEPAPAQVLAPPALGEAASPGACGGPLSKMTFVASVGPSRVKVNCEKVTQELSIEGIPLFHAFAEVTYDFRTGKVTFFAGSKFKAGVGPVEAGFKSGIYLTTDGRGNIDDVGWRVGPEVKGVSGPVNVGVYKDLIDISFVAGLSTEP